MKYIRITNVNEIEPEALHLVGASTKVGKNKIGIFGSGNKYALAYLLRNNYEVLVFSGNTEIKITTKPITFRDITFNQILVNGQETSITTQMGKDWEFWQAIREIYCNALDEGESTMEFVQKINPESGYTQFYISTGTEVTNFVANYDTYFATNKKVLFECEHGRILQKTGDTANIYRKGINVFKTNRKSVFDYDFTDIPIDENRLVKYFWNVEEKMWDLIYRCTNKDVIMQILHHCTESNFIEGQLSSIGSLSPSELSNEFLMCLKTNRFAPLGLSGLLTIEEQNMFILLPTTIFKELRGYMTDDNVGKKFATGKKGELYRIIDVWSNVQESTINEVYKFFREVDFDVPYPIRIAIFDDKHVYGTITDNEIIVSDICIEKGINQTIIVIIEEYIHIKYKVYDETRAFQDSIITEFVSYMKLKNAYLL